MPNSRPRRGRGFAIGFFFLALMGCLAAAIGILYIGLPNAVGSIGEPASDLDPLNRVYLLSYLWLNLEEIDSTAGNPEVQYELEVVQGENAAEVIGRLKSAEVVENEALLRNYLEFRGFDRGIEAGSYLLNGGMSIREIAYALQKADPDSVGLVILEGWRREQIAEAISSKGLNFTAAEFMAASQQAPQEFDFVEDIPVFASLEGFLFPDTYSISAELDAEDFVIKLLENFENRLTPEILLGIEQQGLDIYQAVTLASIVEREAVVAEERDRIASVFLNRIDLGMKLEADPTVQYALGIQLGGSWWKAPLSLADLEIDSPYNTYLYSGLPPGPIANPGLESIRAVAFPEETAYLYFRATCDGSGRHSFSLTFEEHQSKACQ